MRSNQLQNLIRGNARRNWWYSRDLLITIWLCTDRFGYDFLGTAAFNYTEGVGLQTDPTITLLRVFSQGSPVVSALVAAGFILWMWMWIPGMHTFWRASGSGLVIRPSGSGSSGKDLQKPGIRQLSQSGFVLRLQ